MHKRRRMTGFQSISMLLRISLVRISYVAFGSFLLLLLVMGSAEHVSAQGLKFTSPANYPVGRFPTQIRAADFNRDGWLDLAVLGGNTDVDVLVNSGNGTFQSPRSYGLSPVPGVLATGDLNGDGRIDLIIGIRSTAPVVMVLLGNGDGTFQAPISSNSNATQNGTGPYGIVIG